MDNKPHFGVDKKPGGKFRYSFERELTLDEVDDRKRQLRVILTRQKSQAEQLEREKTSAEAELAALLVAVPDEEDEL